MISTHVYTAAVLASPNVPLRIKGGSITLDDTRAPHVEGTLTLAIPDAETLALLDARLGKRIQVAVSAAYPDGTVSRTFDLGIRDRDVRHLAGEVAVSLASDEALLTDYAPLTDDTGAFAVQGSLRGVVNYVLGKIGASLAAAPAGDADVSTYSDATNLATNPRGSANTTSWGASGNPAIVRLTGDPVFGTAIQATWSSAQASPVRLEHSGIPVSPGKSYSASLSARSNTSFPSGAYIGVALFNSAGVEVGGSPQIGRNLGGSYARRTVTFTTPPDAATAILRMVIPSANAGSNLIVSGVMFRETPTDPGDTGYWDGDTADTSTYTYTWSKTPGASSTTRRALVDRQPDSLLWRAGQTALEFLRPIVQAAGYRTVCDENRVWTLRSKDYSAAGALAIRYGVNLIDGTDSIKRDEGLWFDAQVTRYKWNDVNGISRERIDAYALTGTPQRVNVVDINAAYPGPGRSLYAVTRAQGQGRTVTATAVADWRARAEQSSMFELPAAPRQVGKTSRVEFDLDQDRMTLTSRTTDTPDGAINLLVGTINALTGTINNL